MASLRKNVAGQNLPFVLLDLSSGTVKTGVSVSGFVTKDGGAVATIGGTITSLGAGHYVASLTQADTNATVLGFSFTGVSVVPVPFTIFTAAYDPTDAMRLGLGALPAVSAEGAGGLPTRGTGTGQISLTGGKVLLQAAAISAGVFEANALTSIAGAVWNTSIAGTTWPAGTAGLYVTRLDVSVGTISAGSGPTETSIATAVWANSTRLLSANVTVGNMQVEVTLAAGGIKDTSWTAAALSSVADAVWDEQLSGHQTAGMAGRALDESRAGTVIRRGYVVSALASNIQLDSGVSITDSALNDALITIVSGPGAGQSRLFTSWVSSTQSGNVSFNWTTTPTSLSEYVVKPYTRVNLHLVRGAVINALVSGRVDADVGNMQPNTVTASAVASDAVTEIQSGLSTLTAAGVRTAIGMASANLDSQLAAMQATESNIDTNVTTILSRTDVSVGTRQVSTSIPSNFGALSINSSGRVDIGKIAGSERAAFHLAESTENIARGTVGSGSTVTSIVVASITPSLFIADQLVGSAIIFAYDTPTSALRDQKSNITANSLTVLTVTSLTTAPALTDEFVVI